MPATELGAEMTKDGTVYRIIRIVKQSALFETEGVLEVVTEDLLELKGPEGQIEFEVLASERTEYTGPISTIKAPEPIVWRKD